MALMSGTKLAGSIDTGLEELRQQEAALAEQLRVAMEQLNGHRTEQAQAYGQLAKLRLDDITGPDLAGALDAAERRALQLLDESAKARSALEAKIDAVRARIAALESDIDAQGDAVEAADRTLDAAEAALQSKLAKSAAYREQAEAAEEAVRIADEADRKATLAEEDRVEKGKPYENDPLFMYLWKRGFGTSEYRSWGLIKALDQWVARLCNYHDARPNYAMLLEIPERLRTHTERVQEKAQGAIDALAATEKRARDEAGVTALEEALVAEQEARAALEEKLSGAHEELHRLTGELEAFGRGEDENTLAALEVMTDELRRDSLQQLRHEARLTPDPADDVLVGKIGMLEDEIADTQRDVSTRQESLRILAARRADLEKVRTDFRNERYHTPDFQFDDHGALEALLKGLLTGAISGSQYWREVKRNSRKRRKPKSRTTFGSRNYSPSRTTWGTSTRSSGSFRTGGRIGGSGFKTGGGF